mmetsp:Transcript_12844/g.30030  ORF Transcript_12844/g.30030 Transcript_12844/m.30030 type:complete len:223 (-) Transcript_12844:498-1166(-)
MSSSLRRETTFPGPDVHGPPVKSMTREPFRGTARCKSDTATLSAEPVARAGRLSVGTGQGSLRMSSRMDSTTNEHSETGRRNRLRICSAGLPPGIGAACCPGFCWGRPAPVQPRSSPTRAGPYSRFPLIMNALQMLSLDSSYTLMLVPYVITPTSESGGNKCRACVRESASSSSSSFELVQVSRTKRKQGGPCGGTVCNSYSQVVYWGMSSAGRLVSVMFSA